MKLRLGHDLLDKQMMSSDDKKVGRVDGIILELHKTTPPRVVAVESGIETVLHRVHCGTKWLRAIGRRLHVRDDGAAIDIPFTKIKSIGIDVKLMMNVEEAATNEWEDWLREKVVERIPGSGKGKKAGESK